MANGDDPDDDGAGDGDGNGAGGAPVSDQPLTSALKELGPLKPGEKFKVTYNPFVGDITVEREREPRTFMEKFFAAIVGVFFIVLTVTLVFVFPEPTPLQRRVVLGTFAIGGAAFGNQISGMINVDMKLPGKLAISGTGAAAFFVILYLVLPAAE